MHLLLLGLFIAVYLHDLTATATRVGDDGVLRQAEALPGDAWPGLGLGPVVAAVLLPKLLVAVGYVLLCRTALRKLGGKRGEAWMRRVDQAAGVLPLALLALFAVDLTAGALRWARVPLRDTVVVDELLVMLPTLCAVAATWWGYYPIDRRLRTSRIIGRADAGLPIYNPPTLGQYMLAQARHQVALLFVPLIIIAAWSETVLLLGPDGRGWLSATQALLLVPAGALGVFMVAPLVIRHVWDTVPLPDGDIRHAMAGLCSRHGVRVRELLLWRTYGGLVNAAVMGVVAPLRYILLSDALLDQLRRREVEAVMAHEIAHVRRHHMFWLLLVMIATLGLGEQAAQAVLFAMQQPLAEQGPIFIAGYDAAELLRDPQVQLVLIALVSLSLALFTFGWVSRRIERQADVFAARHLAQTSDNPQRDGTGRLLFDTGSLQTMVLALERVARLNHIPTARKMWRHGSIRWRQDHLRSLRETPVDDAEVDRVVGRVKLAALLAAAALGALYAWQWSSSEPPAPILVEAAAIIRSLI